MAAKNEMREVKTKGQRDPEVKLLSNPPVTMTGANVKFMSLWERDDVLFAHIYVELIEVKETIGELDEVDGQMYLQQLTEGSYNTVEWVELTYENGETRKVMAIVNQDPERPGDDAVNFMVDLQTNKDEHGWEVLEDGTVVDHNKGAKYPITYVNAYTAELGLALEHLRTTMGMPEHVAHYAMLHALPFFQNMYMPDMEAHAIKERLPGWSQSKKMAQRMAKIAEAACPPAESFIK